MTKLFDSIKNWTIFSIVNSMASSHLYNLLQSFSNVFNGIFFHSSRVTHSSSWRFFDDLWCIWTYKSCHRFSIGFKSGLIEDLGRTIIFFFWNYVVTDLDVCLGSLSYWKVNRRPRSKLALIVLDFHPEIWYRLQISLFLLLQSIVLFPPPPELKQPQNIIESPLCFDVGTVFFVMKSLTFLVPNLLYINMSKEFNFCWIILQYLFLKAVFFVQKVLAKLNWAAMIWFVKRVSLRSISIQPISI